MPPPLTCDQVTYLAPSFTRWLTMHIEALETYQAELGVLLGTNLDEGRHIEWPSLELPYPLLFALQKDYHTTANMDEMTAIALTRFDRSLPKSPFQG